MVWLAALPLGTSIRLFFGLEDRSGKTEVGRRKTGVGRRKREVGEKNSNELIFNQMKSSLPTGQTGMTQATHRGMIIIATCLPQAGILPKVGTGYPDTGQVVTIRKQL